MANIYTYFENKDMSCQAAFGFFGNNFDHIQNPPFILVENQLNSNGSFEVINTHEYELPNHESNYTLGTSIAYIETVGFWRIQYK